MDYKIIEKKWQDKWFNSDVFTAGLPVNSKKEKKYVLAEFPFPSGDGLHLGHILNYSGLDVVARFWRMMGRDVLFPFGFDSMGIAVENYAVKNNMTPQAALAKSSANVLRQAKAFGLSYDYSKVLMTSDPEYVKWTQWQFIQLFKLGLLYKAPLPINWCPACRTNLTNEELDENGCCDRCHGPMEKKNKEQWNFAITKYADRLVDDLALVDFPENVKEAQRNWVGRSYGAEIDFNAFRVYTTRPDTIFGVSFCAISPEHNLVAEWLAAGRVKNADAVKKYIADAKAKTLIERTDITKEKTGVKIEGVVATNPYNKKEVPIFVADYVLANYATGAIMAVPSEDERDREFAEKFGIEIIEVKDADGRAINSDFMNGMDKDAAIKKAIENGEKAGFAKAAKKYKMTDWGFSRQMYWGEPIPLVYCPEHGWQPVPENELPLLQPVMDNFRPTPEGESPLARATDWVKAKCPVCGGAAMRETDTMPQWAGSCWYYIRFIDPKNDKAFADKELIKKWLPVDHYNGGFEHVTRHMIYARFWYKALFDLGLVPSPEPFAKRTINGLVLGKDGFKMSKSRGNGINPDDLISEMGADAARLFVLFLGPWDHNTLPLDDVKTGVKRFLSKVEGLAARVQDVDGDVAARMKFIKDITERIPDMRFNTSIARMMEYANELGKTDAVPRAGYESLIKALSIFAPHFAEEIWENLGHKDFIASADWDKFDAALAESGDIVVVVSVNGKRRAEINVKKDAKDIEELARDAASKFINAPVKRVVVVPNKMVNFVL
ncbi:MAG: leucine--tRNA ligase [Rickettsiales bacterium]|jgi:leucyl-tRNA synthetase|nr:leucine--tRNA ligase [Rickettsiales bacterium]